MAEGNDTTPKRKRKFGVLLIVMVGAVVLLVMAVYLLEVARTGNGPRGPGAWLRRISAILPPPLGRRRQLASRVVFGSNISGLAKSLLVYANDDKEGRLPPADKWCDFLVGYEYVPPRQFFSHKSDALVGESIVAMNKYVAGKKLARLDPGVVLLFETDFGKDPNGRSEPVNNRLFYQMLKVAGPNTMVYKYRWNQAGGPEILTTRYNKGQGCNVAFVDGRVRFVRTAGLPKLKFKPDANDFDRVYRTYFLTEPNSR